MPDAPLPLAPSERILADAARFTLHETLLLCQHGTEATTVLGTGHGGFIDRWETITYADGCTATPQG